MPALYIMIPVALIIVSIAVWLFFWSVNSGQFDDMEGPAHSILFDDDERPAKSSDSSLPGNPEASSPSADGEEQDPDIND